MIFKMNNAIILFKSTNVGYEIITINENGNVEYKTNNSNDKKIVHIDFFNDLKNELDDAFEKMIHVYNNEKSDIFCVRYRNHDFYSIDLYVDITMMLNHNKLKRLSVYDKYKKMKEKSDTTIFLDELEKNKNIIDVANVESTLNNERNMISFNLIRKDEFQVGETRFFSDTIDVNKDMELPEHLKFVGQLNLNEISKYDLNNLLPKDGMLYFYISPQFYNDKYYNFGKVIYVSLNDNLIRKRITIAKTETIDNFGICDIKNCNEKFSDRYELKDGEEVYLPFEGEELNKIFGFYTDCQMDDDDIKKISNKYIVLLQLGSQIYGEGVTTFLITKEDLKSKNFDNVIYQYSQT